MSDRDENIKLRHRVEELERLLGMRDEFPAPWGLTIIQGKILGLLYRRSLVTDAMLFEAIWGGDSDTNPKVIEVHVCKMRKKLAPLGIEIKTVYGRGYRLSDATKEAMRVLLAQDEQGQWLTFLAPKIERLRQIAAGAA